MHILIGKTVTAVCLMKDGGAIRFSILDGPPVVATAYGECCSTSWIENVENPEALIGTPVLAVEDIEMPEKPYDSRELDVVVFYGLKITTVRGDCVLDYRNSSNGYYGGYLEWGSQQGDGWNPPIAGA